MMKKSSTTPFPMWIIAALAATLMALLGGGIWFYQSQKQGLKKAAIDDLTAIAELKANQIASWRSERLGDAAILSENPFFRKNAARFLENPRDKSAAELRTYLESLQTHYHYSDILLVEPDGRLRLGLGENFRPPRAYVPAISDALNTRKPVFIDLHTETEEPAPHISVVAPLFLDGKHASKPLGAVVLVSDASEFLYPLIQSWPAPSRTAETLLVRREGDGVLFLNDLRHQPDTALKLRIPLSRTDVPAVMAVHGRTGVVEGTDYRGVSVVSVILPIPGSPWFMVAKQDAAEVFSEWQSRALLILVLLMALGGGLGAVGLNAFQRYKKAHYQALYEYEARLRASMERHSITLKAIGDAVIAADADGRVELLNPVAEALTGWKDAEARGRPLEEVFRIVNEKTREKVEDPVTKVLQKGVVVGLANHTLLIAEDGTERPIADSGAPIRDDKGEIIGVVLVFRDQTEERTAHRVNQARMVLLENAPVNTLESLLTKALDEIGELVDSPIGFYHFVEKDQKTLSLQQWSTRTLKEFCRIEGEGLHYDIDQAGVWVDCVREGKPVVHNDYASLPHKKGMPEGHAEVVRELVVPVIREGKVVAIVGVGNKPVEYTEADVQIVARLADATWQLVEVKNAEAELRRIEWLLTERPFSAENSYVPPYGDLAELNTEGLIRSSVGDQMLSDIVSDYLDLLETSAAVYEKNGDYAVGIFSSGWCQFMDSASRRLCRTDDNLEALACGRWHCHESCWSHASKVCMETGKPADVSCEGGLRIYGVPIYAGGEIIGTLNFGYGDPPRDPARLKELAVRYEVSEEDLRFRAEAYESRPPFIIEIARDRAAASARLIGEIVERRQAEELLRISHERFLTVLNSIDATIYVADMDSFEILFMNQYMIDSFGRDMTGEVCWEVFRGGSGQCPHCPNDRLIDENGSPTGVLVWQGRNPITGKWYVNHDRAIKWTDGRLVRLQIATDITDLKKMEEQLHQAQKMESVGRLAGGVAHDYNNMLSVILGYTEMALDKVAPSDSLHEDLSEIYSAARRSSDITRQLLAFARQQTIDPKALDLNETVEGMLKMLRRLIGENIDLSWQPGGGLWPVRMDPSQLDQILANLCVNARDAIADVGNITIETENVAIDEDYCADRVGFVPGEYVLLAVTDDGRGIDKESIDNLFEPFFTTKKMGEGTGLGLATVYGIVKQNEGFINVYSEPGEGTTFRIYLPRHTGECEKERKQAVQQVMAGRGETVMLVEDERSILKIGKKMLESLGYSVLAAEKPEQAVLLAQEHRGEIHLLITDVVMPEMNGRDLAEHLKALYPDLRILFISGYTADVIAHQGVLDDGVCFMQKPFSKQELGAKVREALKG